MFKTATNFNDYFGNMKVGELFKQPELAQTLERIADKGVSEFYRARPPTCWWRRCRPIKA